MTDKIAAIYQYRDLSGAVVHESVRYEPKSFTQRRPNGKGGYIYSLSGIEPVLYRLPEITRAISKGIPVFLVEGEKDADNLVKLGFEATTCPMGAGKWRDSYTEALRGAQVLVIPDLDDIGWRHALSVAEKLYCGTKVIKILDLSRNKS